MKTADDIEREIRRFLVDNFLFGRSGELRGNAPLMGNVIDSHGVVELVVFLQDQFAITVDDEEVTTENLDSVENAVAFVKSKLRDES